jgi:peptidoglycan pentaglycine glycine transferase (the first glycine)
MEIKKVKNHQEWNDFLHSLNFNTFLHSDGWVGFNKRYGHKTWKLGLYEDKKLVSIALVIKIEAKRGKFLFIPHGPQSKDFSSGELVTWVEYLKELAEKENCDFLRVSPIYENTDLNRKYFRQAGFRGGPLHMHAELSTVVDLTPNEKSILLNMRKTTRQMIKKGVKLVEKGEVEINSVKEITDEMHEVYISTTKRGGFVPYSRKYLQEEFNAFHKTGNCELVEVKYKDNVLSWGLFIFCGKRSFYHQGANLLHREVPSSYLIHWTGMQKAKAAGCETYDFWGVSPKGDKDHPWANISLFKRGFGGEDVELVHAQDYPLNWKYWITWGIETIRSKRRGF